jgi:hypothetical protein
MLRIIGQCNAADIKEVAGLALSVEDPAKFDTGSLTKKQKLVFRFLQTAFEKKISITLILTVVKEVLFWGSDAEDRKGYMEVKLNRNAKIADILKFRALWQ